jgi:hypothetical protein
VNAFNFALKMPADCVKAQIQVAISHNDLAKTDF